MRGGEGKDYKMCPNSNIFFLTAGLVRKGGELSQGRQCSGSGLFRGTLVIGGRVGARGGGGRGGGVPWRSCRRSWQPGSWARWIPGHGFDSHRGELESVKPHEAARYPARL